MSSRLWTYQSPVVVDVLRATGVYRADWERTPLAWRAAYQIMADAMTAEGLDCAGSPPVWAWATGDGQPPPPHVARELLSEVELAAGRITITLDVPDEAMLLSSYHQWCETLNGGPAVIHRNLQSADDLWQATLAELRAEWIVRVDPLAI